MKKIVSILLVAVAAVAAFLAFPSTADSFTPPPLATLVTHPVVSFELAVNIPDANLKTALHNLTGIPSNQSIYPSDLAALTGSINFSDRNIADAQGIQYCKNITYLDMSRNPISNLPSLTGMTALKTLRLSGCGLGAWPSGKLPPSLSTLTLSKNGIDELPDTLSDAGGTWKNLDLSTNDIEELPDWILSLPSLIMLDLSHNDLGKIPDDISGLTKLEQLYVGDNGLESLPDVLCDMPNLHDLVASDNSLYSLPEDIGDHLYTLSVPYNRIERLPDSIGDSSTLYFIDVMLNRLTSLPSNFDDHGYDFINVEFNFIDMSSGSSARTMLEAMDSNMEKYYRRQLAPVTSLTAMPGSDSVTLTWQGGVNGSEGDATWTVTGYSVYQYDNGMVKLADVDADTLTYTHTGLTPETAYQYRVGVNYDVVALAWGYDVSTRGYARVETTTLPVAAQSSAAAESSAAAAETETVSAETSPSVSAAVSASASSPAATQSVEDASAQGTSAGMPGWLIPTIAAAGALVLGAGTTLLIIKLKKK